MEKSRCVVVGAAPMEEVDFLQSQIGPQDFVICADGGYRHLQKAGITPDLLMGDLDSIDVLPADIPTVKFDPVKDDTDTRIALKEGLRRGFEDFLILGGTGARLDHTIANLQNLFYLKAQGASGVLADASTRAFMLQDEEVLMPDEGYRYLSVFSFTPQCLGVSLQGVKYPLSGYTMESHFPIGVSNEFTDICCKIGVKQGVLLVLLVRE